MEINLTMNWLVDSLSILQMVGWLNDPQIVWMIFLVGRFNDSFGVDFMILGVVDWTVLWLSDWMIFLSIDSLVDWMILWSTRRSFHELNQSLSGWLNDWMILRLVDWILCWLRNKCTWERRCDRMISRLICYPVDLWVPRTICKFHRSCNR